MLFLAPGTRFLTKVLNRLSSHNSLSVFKWECKYTFKREDSHKKIGCFCFLEKPAVIEIKEEKRLGSNARSPHQSFIKDLRSV